MASYDYAKYFSSTIVTTGSTTFNNLFDSTSSSRLWSELVDPLVDSLIVQQTSGGYRFGAALPTSVATSNTGDTISDIYKLYSGSTSILAEVTFVNVSNQTYSTGLVVALGSEYGFGLSGTTISDIKNELANNVSSALGSTTAKECYFTKIIVSGGKFAFASKTPTTFAFNALYDPSNVSQLLTATIPTINFNLTRGTTSTRSLTIIVTKTYATIITSLNTRTLKNSYAISTGTTYIITPTFLNNRKTTDYNKGQIGGGTLTGVVPANHQSYMYDNAKTVIDDIITGNTRTGTISAGTTGVTGVRFITSMTDDGQSISSTYCSHTITKWTASGYNFYRDSAQNSAVTDPSYSTYNIGTTTLTIYPVAISQTCNETMYMCLYDVDEGQISYLLGGDDLINRYYVPPTDILNYTTGKTTVSDQTLHTYYLDSSFSYVQYDNTLYGPTTGASYVTPNAYFPKIATFKFTSKGEDLPRNLDGGFITYGFENNVTSDGAFYHTSVRYHFPHRSDEHFIEYGSKRGSGTTYYRDSIIYLGVRKNTLDFIEGITQKTAPNGWDDTISGIHYYEPIAYANKLSTMNDLADKLTCFHGRSVFYYIDNDDYEYLYVLKNWFLTQLWTGGCNFSSKYSSYPQTLNPTKRRYLRFTYNGTTYYPTELNHSNGIRWFHYPTWSSITQTGFTYVDGMWFKQPPFTNNNTVAVISGFTETQWTNGSSSLSSRYVQTYNYNGYGPISSYSVGTVSIVMKTTDEDNRNRDRRAIGDYEHNTNFSILFTPSYILHDWIYDSTDNFNYAIGQQDEEHRWIGFEENRLPMIGDVYTEQY